MIATEHDRPAKRQKLDCLFRFSNSQRKAERVRAKPCSHAIAHAPGSDICIGAPPRPPRVPDGCPACTASILCTSFLRCPLRRRLKIAFTATRRRGQ